MKKIGLMLVCFATLAFASCGTSNVLSSNSAASTAGSACGAAVKGLYSSYKSTGKVDLTNATNLSNALVLATSYSQLQSHKGDSSYQKAFTTGLISGGTGLLTTANATSFLGTLINSTGLANVNAQNIAQKAETVSTIITLLNALN